MTHNDRIEIPYSKRFLWMSFFASICFIVLAVSFVIEPPKSSNYFFRKFELTAVISWIAIVFFGTIAVFSVRKIMSNKPGLIISQVGIDDNSGGRALGLIPWSDIEEINVMEVRQQKFMVLILNNPDEHINNTTNFFKKSAMKSKWKTYGSPLTISATGLQMEFSDLYALLVDKMLEYKTDGMISE